MARPEDGSDREAAEFAPMPQRFVACASRDAADGTAAGAAGLRLLAYGDSLTAGFYSDGDRFAPYGAALCEALATLGAPTAAPPEVWVCGLSGLLAAEMAQSLDGRTIKDCVDRKGKGLRRILDTEGHFDAVLIMAGTNDLGDDELSPSAIATTVQALHTACHVEGVRTVSLSVPPNEEVSASPSYRRRWERVNSVLREWAQGPGAREGVLFHVDTAKIVPFSEDNELWEEDGLHLSPQGSSRLGNLLAPYFKPLGVALPPAPRPSPLAAWPAMPHRMPTSAGEPRWRILAYGDSNTAGYHCFGNLFAPYGETLGTCLLPDAPSEILVCGLSGRTAAEMAAKSDTDELRDVPERRQGKGVVGIGPLLEEHGPFDLALVMVGTNDLGKAKAESIVADTKAIHEVCHRVGVRTVALGVPLSRATSLDNRYSRKRLQVNLMVRDWAAGAGAAQGVVLYVDTGALLPYDEDSGFWEMDGLHFSRAGSHELGTRLAPLLRPVLSTGTLALAVAGGVEQLPAAGGHPS